jgi:hypothetical protein
MPIFEVEKVRFDGVSVVVVFTFWGGLRTGNGISREESKHVYQTILVDCVTAYSVEKYVTEAAAGHAEWCDVVKSSYRIGETYLRGELLLIQFDDADPRYREILAREGARPIRA